jgi:hypothetical protein
MSYVTSQDGTRIWYDVIGNGDPLVLIGGSSLVSNQWEFGLRFRLEGGQARRQGRRGCRDTRG